MTCSLSTAPRRRGAEFAPERHKSEVVRASWDQTRIWRKTFERADLSAGEAREGGGLAEPAVDRAQRSIRAKTPLKSAPFLRGAVLRKRRWIEGKNERVAEWERRMPAGVHGQPGSNPGGRATVLFRKRSGRSLANSCRRSRGSQELRRMLPGLHSKMFGLDKPCRRFFVLFLGNEDRAANAGGTTLTLCSRFESGWLHSGGHSSMGERENVSPTLVVARSFSSERHGHDPDRRFSGRRGRADPPHLARPLAGDREGLPHREDPRRAREAGAPPPAPDRGERRDAGGPGEGRRRGAEVDRAHLRA